ncbi:MAG: methyltransferase [Flavobacteriaceae bacterium]|nr:MAG: methyltransferase [Flavobacteriaceae bacterium]
MEDKLLEYLKAHSSPESELLLQLKRETYQKTTQPHMLSGSYQGLLLGMISKMIQPLNILEIGTFTGYSALCLVEGLKEGGSLITLDKNDELAYLCRKYFSLHPKGHQIDYQLGDASDLIPKLNLNFDLVFIDADKASYQNYYNLVVQKLNPGGVILVDNVLWYNKVLEEPGPKDSDTLALQLFNKQVRLDPLVEVIMLPIRDGISLIRKKP